MKQKVSEYDQQMPQSHTAHLPTAPWEETQNTDSHMTVRTQLK